MTHFHRAAISCRIGPRRTRFLLVFCVFAPLCLCVSFAGRRPSFLPPRLTRWPLWKIPSLLTNNTRTSPRAALTPIHIPQRCRRASLVTTGRGPNARPIQPSSITNCVIAASPSFFSLTICSGMSAQGLFSEKTCEKIPRKAICARGTEQLDHAVADQFGRASLDLRPIERANLELLPALPAFAEPRDRQRRSPRGRPGSGPPRRPFRRR